MYLRYVSHPDSAFPASRPRPFSRDTYSRYMSLSQAPNSVDEAEEGKQAKAEAFKALGGEKREAID
jgi:hypothetical protein